MLIIVKYGGVDERSVVSQNGRDLLRQARFIAHDYLFKITTSIVKQTREWRAVIIDIVGGCDVFIPFVDGQSIRMGFIRLRRKGSFYLFNPSI